MQARYQPHVIPSVLVDPEAESNRTFRPAWLGPDGQFFPGSSHAAISTDHATGYQNFGHGYVRLYTTPRQGELGFALGGYSYSSKRVEPTDAQLDALAQLAKRLGKPERIYVDGVDEPVKAKVLERVA
jgi:hypothetical protein